jgi:hypothetical protein
MEDLNKDSLFDLKLSASGKLYIRKFVFITGVVTIAGVLLSLLFLVESIFRIVHYHPLPGVFPLLHIRYRFAPFTSIIYSLLIFCQLFFLLRTRKNFSDGVRYSDEEKFGQAFADLYRNSVWSLLAVLLSLLIGLFDFVITLRYHFY